MGISYVIITAIVTQFLLQFGILNLHPHTHISFAIAKGANCI